MDPSARMTHPLTVRRHGNASAWTSPLSITLSSRSQSSDADDMGRRSVIGLHLSGRLIQTLQRRLALCGLSKQQIERRDSKYQLSWTFLRAGPYPVTSGMGHLRP